MSFNGIFNGEVQQANIRKVQNGWRYCISCQHANIEPSAPAFAVRCGDCYKKREPNRFCMDCGDELEADRKDYARKNGGECRRCRYCTKKLDAVDNPRYCENCTILHPDDWQCPAAQLVPTSSSQTPL